MVTISCSPYPACKIARMGRLGCTAIWTGKSPSFDCRPAGFKDQPLGRRIVPPRVMPGQIALCFRFGPFASPAIVSLPVVACSAALGT